MVTREDIIVKLVAIDHNPHWTDRAERKELDPQTCTWVDLRLSSSCSCSCSKVLIDNNDNSVILIFFLWIIHYMT